MLKVVIACFSIIGLVVWYLHFYQGLLFCFCHKEGKRKKAVFYLCIYLLIYLVFIKWESMFSYAGTREDPLWRVVINIQAQRVFFWENYRILWEFWKYYKCAYSYFTWMVSLTINLINKIHYYMRWENIHLYLSRSIL